MHFNYQFKKQKPFFSEHTCIIFQFSLGPPNPKSTLIYLVSSLYRKHLRGPAQREGPSFLHQPLLVQLPPPSTTPFGVPRASQSCPFFILVTLCKAQSWETRGDSRDNHCDISYEPSGGRDPILTYFPKSVPKQRSLGHHWMRSCGVVTCSTCAYIQLYQV